MYIFDANVFINSIRNEEETLVDVEKFINKLIYNEIKVLIPDLCFYEVIYNLKKKEKVNDKMVEIIDIFLWLDNLIIYKLDSKEYKKVLDISLKYNTSTYDGTYLYLHDLFSEQIILTLDKRFYNSLKNNKNIILLK